METLTPHWGFHEATVNGVSLPTLMIEAMILRRAHFPSGMIKFAPSGLTETIHRIITKVIFVRSPNQVILC